MRSEHFSQYELEFEMSKCLAFGDEGDIADRVGVSAGMVSQYLNYHDDRESPVFKAAAILAAWIEQDETRGECALLTFCRFVRRAHPVTLDLNLATERRKSHKERTDFYIAEAEDRPLDDRIRELAESIDQDQRLLSALKAERERQKQRAIFPGREVKHNAASAVKAAVNGNGGRK